jgi:hypothetical protein
MSRGAIDAMLRERRLAAMRAEEQSAYRPHARHGYDPNQLRVPKGHSDGGQWTSTGRGPALRIAEKGGPPQTFDSSPGPPTVIAPTLAFPAPGSSEDLSPSVEPVTLDRDLRKFGQPVINIGPAGSAPIPPPATGSATLRPYGGHGGGHHVPAKRAFEGAPGYNPNTALAIPNEELARLGVTNHFTITSAQQAGYRALAQSGAPLTWEAMATIETNALIRAGMASDVARATVNRAIQALQKAGIQPIRIPWGGP